MDSEKQISNFMSLDRGLKKLVYKSKLKSSAGYLDPRRRVLDMRPDIQKPNGKQDGVAICQCILMALVSFYLVNLRSRFDETLGRISDGKIVHRGFVDQSLNPESNPRPDIKILGREFKSLAKSFRFAAGHLKSRYQTGCSDQPLYFELCYDKRLDVTTSSLSYQILFLQLYKELLYFAPYPLLQKYVLAQCMLFFTNRDSSSLYFSSGNNPSK